jgi:excinuclease ABC subunit A
VGTVTEIYDFLRLLYARAGIPHCPECGREVAKQSAQEIVDVVADMPEGARLLILSPLVRGRKGTHQMVLEEIRKAGFVRARVDGRVYELDEDIQMDRYKIHNIEAVVDRIVIHQNGESDEKQVFLSRLTDSIETALKFGDGYLVIQDITDAEKPHDHYFSEQDTARR